MLAMSSSVASIDGMATEDAREKQPFAVAALETLPAMEDSQAHPFSCNVCRRSYKRLDHLARHFRSRMTSQAFQESVAG